MSDFDSVVVFVDALAYEEKRRLEGASKFLSWCRPVQPGYGYSINVKSELFAGLRPDDAGFLNEWNYERGAGYKWAKYLGRLDKLLSANRLIKRGTSKIVSRLIGESLRNIPFPLLSSVYRTGVTAYERAYPQPTVFTENQVKRFLYSEESGDDGAFDALFTDLQTSEEPVSAFLALAQLDHVMHCDGKSGSAYDSEVFKVDERLMQIWELLEKRGYSGRLAVVSDHGMAEVTKEISFDLGTSIPGLGRRYGYFVDATMVRIWTEDDSVRKEIDDWLADADPALQVLDEETRRCWGISSAGFGDIIVLLEEGAIFVPNFFSDFGCKAMHGYLPTLASQQGIIASSASLDAHSGAAPLAAVEVFSRLQHFYRRGTPA